jgi:hypothetical protein
MSCSWHPLLLTLCAATAVLVKLRPRPWSVARWQVSVLISGDKVLSSTGAER